MNDKVQYNILNCVPNNHGPFSLRERWLNLKQQCTSGLAVIIVCLRCCDACVVPEVCCLVPTLGWGAGRGQRESVSCALGKTFAFL